MIKLYEIAENFKNIQALLEDETIPAEVIEAALQEIQGKFEDKAENIVNFIKSMEAEALAYREEEKRLAANRKALENKAESMKNYLFTNMKVMGYTTVKTPLFKLNVKKNPASVVVDDLAIIPEDFLVFTMEANKKKLAEKLKAGEQVEGCHLEQKESLSIR